MKNIFTEIQEAKVSTNTFDLTHDVKLSTRYGRLTPICLIETIPGDKFKLKGSAMVRLAPTIAPVMHRSDVYLHYFFVPNRLSWEGWEDFITGGELGTDTTTPPYIDYNSSSAVIGGLADYLGLPTAGDVGTSKPMTISAFPFAAYQKIYEDYFRDQNLIGKRDVSLSDGDNTSKIATLTPTQQRAWGHDYFTAALPWTQRGPEALLPLVGTASIEPKLVGGEVSQPFRNFESPHAAETAAGTWNLQSETPEWIPHFVHAGGGADHAGYFAVEDSHQVDLLGSTTTTIIDLRRAIKLQEWLERNAVGGARYIENIQIHFGVSSSDKRLQRPEYIGGFQSPVKMSEVLQTSETDAGTPQGNMAGHGISVGGSKTYSYYAEEHGYIIGILSILPKTGYQQGINKHWLRTDKLDYAWPSFAHIGEQAIQNQELYLAGDATDTDTWGYIPRYSEYKFQNNRVAGDYRTTLDFWHMSRKFAALPPLAQDFVEMSPTEVDRVFAVQDSTDELWCQVVNEIKATRKLPIFGTPKL